jgi:hypothetical protein
MDQAACADACHYRAAEDPGAKQENGSQRGEPMLRYVYFGTNNLEKAVALYTAARCSAQRRDMA